MSNMSEKIVAFFYKKHIVGNMKGYANTYEIGDWITHARFLLSEIDDETIENLFDRADTIVYAQYVGIWISALLKKEKYIPQIVSYLLKSENPYYSGIVFSALLLFDDLPVISAYHYQQFLEKNERDIEKRYFVSITFYCLQYIDSKYNTNYSKKYSGISVPTKYQKMINRILKFSEILRANITFKNNDCEFFKAELTKLLSINASPKEYACGILKIRNIDSFIHNTYLMPFNNNTVYIFHYEVKYFLGSKNSNVELKNEKNIKEKLLETNYLFDILAGIEEDWYYQLSTDIIIIAFEKMLKILPDSAYIYEQYATHLLLRGESHDEEAKLYYQKAIILRQNYECVYDEHLRTTYIMKK